MGKMSQKVQNSNKKPTSGYSNLKRSFRKVASGQDSSTNIRKTNLDEKETSEVSDSASSLLSNSNYPGETCRPCDATDVSYATERSLCEIAEEKSKQVYSKKSSKGKETGELHPEHNLLSRHSQIMRGKIMNEASRPFSSKKKDISEVRRSSLQSNTESSTMKENKSFLSKHNSIYVWPNASAESRLPSSDEQLFVTPKSNYSNRSIDKSSIIQEHIVEGHSRVISTVLLKEKRISKSTCSRNIRKRLLKERETLSKETIKPTTIVPEHQNDSQSERQSVIGKNSHSGNQILINKSFINPELHVEDLHQVSFGSSYSERRFFKSGGLRKRLMPIRDMISYEDEEEPNAEQTNNLGKEEIVESLATEKNKLHLAKNAHVWPNDAADCYSFSEDSNRTQKHQLLCSYGQLFSSSKRNYSRGSVSESSINKKFAIEEVLPQVTSSKSSEKKKICKRTHSRKIRKRLLKKRETLAKETKKAMTIVSEEHQKDDKNDSSSERQYITGKKNYVPGGQILIKDSLINPELHVEHLHQASLSSTSSERRFLKWRRLRKRVMPINDMISYEDENESNVEETKNLGKEEIAESLAKDRSKLQPNDAVDCHSLSQESYENRAYQSLSPNRQLFVSPKSNYSCGSGNESSINQERAMEEEFPQMTSSASFEEKRFCKRAYSRNNIKQLLKKKKALSKEIKETTTNIVLGEHQNDSRRERQFVSSKNGYYLGNQILFKRIHYFRDENEFTAQTPENTSDRPETQLHSGDEHSITANGDGVPVDINLGSASTSLASKSAGRISKRIRIRKTIYYSKRSFPSDIPETSSSINTTEDQRDYATRSRQTQESLPSTPHGVKSKPNLMPFWLGSSGIQTYSRTTLPNRKAETDYALPFQLDASSNSTANNAREKKQLTLNSQCSDDIKLTPDTNEISDPAKQIVLERRIRKNVTNNKPSSDSGNNLSSLQITEEIWHHSHINTNSLFLVMKNRCLFNLDEDYTVCMQIVRNYPVSNSTGGSEAEKNNPVGSKKIMEGDCLRFDESGPSDSTRNTENFLCTAPSYKMYFGQYEYESAIPYEYGSGIIKIHHSDVTDGSSENSTRNETPGAQQPERDSLFNAQGNLHSLTLIDAFSSIVHGSVKCGTSYCKDINIEVAKLFHKYISKKRAVNICSLDGSGASKPPILGYYTNARKLPIPVDCVRNRKSDKAILSRLISKAIFNSVAFSTTSEDSDQSKNSNFSIIIRSPRLVFKEQLQAMRLMVIDDEDVCAICMNAYEEGDVLDCLQCKHKFHDDCINIWMDVRMTCPMCRASCYSEVC